MAVRLDYPDVDTMVKQKLPKLWETCEEKPDKWTSNSFHWKMLQFVAGDLRLVNEFVFDLLVKTIASTVKTVKTARVDQTSSQLVRIVLNKSIF